MAERARLESVYTFTGIEGSNPSLSAYQIVLTDPYLLLLHLLFNVRRSILDVNGKM